MQQPPINRQDRLAARKLAESNATTNYFLGATRRTWMTNAVTIPSLPAEKGVSRSPRGRGKGTAVANTVSAPAIPKSVQDGGQARSTATPQSTASHTTSSLTERLSAPHGTTETTRKRSLDVADLGVNTRRCSGSHPGGQPSTASTVPSAEAARTSHPLPDSSVLTKNESQLVINSALYRMNSFQAGIVRLGMIETHRFSLLREACVKNDLFYLCVHQVFCTVSVNPRWSSMNGLNEDQSAGLALLSLILLPNKDVSVEVLRFFAGLPAPIETLIIGKVVYKDIMGMVAVFLQRLATGWDVLREKCFKRKFPPFVEELIHVFEVHSPVLQRVLFNSIHRQLGGANNAKLCRQGLSLFDTNQSQYRAQRKKDASADPRVQTVIPDELRLVGERYKELWKEANESTVQGPLGKHAVTFEQSRPPLLHIAPNEHPSGTLPTRQTWASVPQTADQQQQRGHMQWASAPNHLTRAHSTNDLRGSSAFANGPSSATRIQQFISPRIPPNFVLQSSPSGADNFPTHVAGTAGQGPVPQQRRARPPLSSRPLVPRIPTPVAQHSYVGRRRHLESRSPTIHWSTHHHSFIPAAGHEPIQTSVPDPSRLALHQAYLKSPIAEKINGTGLVQPDVRLYQYLESFAIPPQAIDPESSLLRWEFCTTVSDMTKKAVDMTASDGQVKRQVFDGCLLYRLRSVEVAQSLHAIEASEWSVKDMSWPPGCFVTINDVGIELRRKIHHGKDLPVDLTPHIREGANNIMIGLLRSQEGTKAKRYAMAVEIVEVGDETRINSAPTMLAADDSLRSITQALKAPYGTTAGDDDEVQVVDSHLSIDLIDPFMATIFDIPARGNACTHRECFDLQTFFQTRKSRVKDGPTSPDEWKCPICKQDARPQSLMVDCFLKAVRDSLVTSGAAANARAILIGADGSWNIKKDDDDTVGTKEDPNATMVDSLATSKDTEPGCIQRTGSLVIAIDDD
ncbi:hypothetical protein GJ744_000802 [Endocarpon pusillum]|uniref:SP-RING-type domain-containing protein n=1 Tax=Endocarpon pusillum TaxID=364733 RepID=A0A8H7AT54_9EURO|nr:hypothetical protein GJ744_000802 [Endocarpon pusillum]